VHHLPGQLERSCRFRTNTQIGKQRQGCLVAQAVPSYDKVRGLPAQGAVPYRPRLLTTSGSGTASRGCSGGWHLHMRAEMTSGSGSGAGGSCVTSFFASAACTCLRQVSSQALHRTEQAAATAAGGWHQSRLSVQNPPVKPSACPKVFLYATRLPVLLRKTFSLAQTGPEPSRTLPYHHPAYGVLTAQQPTHFGTR
jgi:hypothetical protein